MNQWLNLLKRGTGSNLVDMGRATVRGVFYLRGKSTPESTCDVGEEVITAELRVR